MRFLLLLLPNLYDLFTLLMIGYAFFLNNASLLKIPFGMACLLIYATTRVGIFAGKIIHMMIGGNPEETDMAESPEVVVKRMILGVGPQCVLIIICQVILTLFILQNPALAKMTVPDKVQPQQEEQVLEPESENVVQQQEEVNAQEIPAEQGTVSQADKEDISAEAKLPEPQNTQAVNTKRNVVTKKKSAAKTNEQVVASSGSNVYYDIPDNTLKVVGISPAARRISEQSSVVGSTSNGNWNFSASESSVKVAQNTAPAASTASGNGNMQPKRYPGDDNPVNTHWGYYRYAESVKQNGTTHNSVPANNSTNSNNIPANTLRSIGY